MHKILQVKKCAFTFFFLHFSLQSIALVISGLHMQCQDPAGNQYSCLPIPLYRQTVSEVQEKSMNYKGADQRSCISLRATSLLPWWQLGLVCHSLRDPCELIMWLCEHSPSLFLKKQQSLLFLKCDSGCRGRIPCPLSGGQLK